jgi:cytochrome b pre-mRNA-processing protein 3
MFDWLTQRTAVTRKALDLYGRVVAAARNTGFYGPGRVSDTPEGRFELVALHLFLVAERVKALESGGDALAQRLIEAFVDDMDDCMREMGVGDLTVPKRVKRAAATFYDHAGEYRAALAQGAPRGPADPLAAIVARNMVPGAAQTAFPETLAAYIRSAHDQLQRQRPADVADGRWDFTMLPITLETTA